MKHTSNITRLLAVLALALAVVLVIVVVSGAGGDDDGKSKDKVTKTKNQNKPKTKKKSYEVQDGDTLTGIAQKTGISIDRIQALNPDLDPQALIAGQKLKLR